MKIIMFLSGNIVMKLCVVEIKEYVTFHSECTFESIILPAILFADVQMSTAKNADSLQRVAYPLANITVEYNLKISTRKTKIIVLKEKQASR
jgi:hypothetical protein